MTGAAGTGADSAAGRWAGATFASALGTADASMWARHVGLGQAAVSSRPLDGRRIEGVLLHESAHGRAQTLDGLRRCGGCGRGPTHRGPAPGPGRLPMPQRLRPARCGQAPPRSVPVSPVSLSTSTSTPAVGAGTSSTTLSVSSSIRISSLSTAIARLPAPLQKRGVGDRFGQHRHLDLDRHCTVSLTVRAPLHGRWPVARLRRGAAPNAPGTGDERGSSASHMASRDLRGMARVPLMRSSCVTPPGRDRAPSRPGPAARPCGR